MADGPVLVTGGTGFVGAAVLARLVASGRPVRALTRTAAGEEALRALGADPVRGDLADAASLRAAADGCVSVFHVAGLNGFCLPDPAELDRVNVEGTQAVVAAAAAVGARRVVYTSSAATIGEPHGVVGREDTPHRGTFLSAYERSKWLAEQVAFTTARSGGVDLVSVNPASVQGPGRTRGTAKLLIGYLNGSLRAVIDSRMSVVDVDDCAAAHLLAEERGVAGRRYLVSGATLTVREAMDLLGRVVGLTDRPRALPPSLAMATATLIGAVGRIRRRRAPFCREMMRTLLHGHAYDGSLAERELGLHYTPLEETLRRTVRWYRDNGLVTRPLPGLTAPAASPGGG
jgi:dihydroflavonol-4-reductase